MAQKTVKTTGLVDGSVHWEITDYFKKTDVGDVGYICCLDGVVVTDGAGIDGEVVTVRVSLEVGDFHTIIG